MGNSKEGKTKYVKLNEAVGKSESTESLSLLCVVMLVAE
jgi:hypothetical protein